MNAKLLFEDKNVDMIIDRLPTLHVEEKEDAVVFKPTSQSWLTIKTDKVDLWVGKKDVVLEHGDKKFRLSGCVLKNGSLVFNKVHYAI
jgi:hypothetical protein